MKTVTLKQFRNSRTEMTVKEFEAIYGSNLGISEDDDAPKSILAYYDGLFIEVKQDGSYYCLIERSEYYGKTDAELALIEEELYEWGDGEYFNVDKYSRRKLTRDMVYLPSINVTTYSFNGQQYINDTRMEDVPKSRVNNISKADEATLWNVFKIYVERF